MTIMTVRMDQLQRAGQIDLPKVEENLLEEKKNILSKIPESTLKEVVGQELMAYCKGVMNYLNMLVAERKKQ